jgi:hypothetical protein
METVRGIIAYSETRRLSGAGPVVLFETLALGTLEALWL